MEEPNPWAPQWSDSHGRPWDYHKDKLELWTDAAYQRLQKKIESVPQGHLRDDALVRITRLDCSSPDRTLVPCEPSASTPEADVWQKSLVRVSVSGADYAKALAQVLKGLVCSDNHDSTDSMDASSIYVLRGLLPKKDPFVGRIIGVGRLGKIDSEAPALVESILSPRHPEDCPVSASLSDDDREKLLYVKHAAENPGK